MSDTTTIVIFGASGDLTRRKLLPALYHLHAKEELHESINIVGVSRSEYSHDDFRKRMKEGVQEFEPTLFDESQWETLAQRIWYVPADVSEADEMQKLKDFLDEQETDATNHLYYLSVAPFLYEAIIGNLGTTRLAQDNNGGWRRIVIEKPFGTDLESALQLNHAVHTVFDENQVYRIDHYLGKETAQNILFFRFANTIFEPIWNRNYIDNVQLTVSETVDVGHRAGYYDKSGVMRDMFQNHILQLLTLIAMEPPASFNADTLRNEKVKVLQSVRPVDLNDTVRAQYEGYLQAEDVAENSQTATFAALKLHIDNWRWQDVPFYLRSGKAMERKTSEINIVFKRPPHLMFDMPKEAHIHRNILSILIQPDEGIHLKFETKVPETMQKTHSVDMEWHYRTSFSELTIPDAYVRLLLDALNGDATLFTRSDEIESAWELVDPIIEGWTEQNIPELITYKKGTWGPKESHKLLARRKNIWRLGEQHDD